MGTKICILKIIKFFKLNILDTTNRSRDEAEVLINNKKASNKFEALRELRKAKREPVEDTRPGHTGPDLPSGQQWKMFVRACTILYNHKR